MPLIFTLAARNLFHDRLRFVATVIGIVFSMLLVTVQMGLFSGFGSMVTTMIDHANADLWVMPVETKCFEDPSMLDEQTRFRAPLQRIVSWHPEHRLLSYFFSNEKTIFQSCLMSTTVHPFACASSSALSRWPMDDSRS